MKKIFLIIVIFIGSVIFAGNSQVLFPQKDTVQQDTTKKKIETTQQLLFKKEPQKLTDLEKKKLEYLEYQQRSKQIDKNFDKMDRQEFVMDSLLGKKKIDTTRVK